ncbi:MAG: nucleotidyltransferase family protein [Bacteroidales bacterium]|nr:nucleotidyltransferase family protein [Bacteroidales bacterium]
MKPKEAIILAGGFGTRLQSVVTGVPKPMAPVRNKPFLEYLLNHLIDYGIEHVVLSVGYKAEMIQSYFGKKFHSMDISYALEKEPLGTGGGIQLAMNDIPGTGTFILNGDTFFDVNLDDLADFHFSNQSDLTVSAKIMKDSSRYGTLEVKGTLVTDFKEKGTVTSGMINGGVYITRTNIFRKFDMPSKFSFEKDFLEKKLQKLKICAMSSNAYFVDIGIPEDYERAQKELPSRYST